MQKMNVLTVASKGSQVFSAGKPTIPVIDRQPGTEKKNADPSSSLPRGESYPIPAFFEYRIKAREFDPL